MMNKTILSNGLTLLYLHTPQDPIAACHFFLPVGAVHESPRQSGISTLMWALFLKGTKARSARQFAEELESIGAFLGAGPTYDYSEVSCHATSDKIIEALTILQDALLNTTYPDPQIQKEKGALLAAIQAKKENIFTISQEILNAHLFPNHAYGRPPSGDEQTVTPLNQKNLLDWHDQVVTPKGTILSMASDRPFEEMFPHIERLFGSKVWSSYKRTTTLIHGECAVPTATREIKNPSHFEQSYLMIGFPAAPVHSIDYVPLKVLNALLGGGMSARLFNELREKQGLAYEVGSFFASRKQGSALVIHMGLQLERMEEAKFGIFQQLKRLQTEPVPMEELNQIKNQIKGAFILDQQTNSQRAHYRGWWEILGLGADYDRIFMSQVEVLTPLRIQELAQQYFNQPYVGVETVPKGK